jgi:glycosyltransferase involved in cell wall biosynthesis
MIASQTPHTKFTLPNFNLAIDGNEANILNRVGSNVYAFEIIKSLHQILKNQPQVRVTVLLATKPISELPPERANWQYLLVTPKPFWTQWALPKHLFWHRADYDVLFTPGHYAPRFSAVPYISSVMDLAFLKFPEAFAKKDYLQLKAWTEYSVKQAKKVVAISNFTKQEIRQAYQITDTDIILAPPSAAPITGRFNRHQFEKFCTKQGITPPYILYMGTIQPRKNLIRLIEAFEQILEDAPPASLKKNLDNLADLKLVLAGKIGWLADEILQKIQTSPVRDKIILTGFVPAQNKFALYKYAKATVMLSNYEGFGIPALEAMQAGTIPVVANSSSLPEVVDKAGIMVNPNHVESIANGLLQAFYLSPADRSELIRLGKDQVKKFSWLNSANLILNELAKIAKP